MNAQVDKVLSLPSYQRALGIVVIMVLLAAGFYYLIYQAQMDQYDGLVKTRKSAQVLLNKNQKIANNLDVYRVEYEKMQVKLDAALGELPLKKEIPNLLTSIGDLARDKGLEILRFKPAGESPKDFYAEVPVGLKLTGSYHQAAAFFDAVSKMERIVNIKKLSLGSPKNVGGKTSLVVDCNAVTFRFIEAAPKKKGGKRK